MDMGTRRATVKSRTRLKRLSVQTRAVANGERPRVRLCPCCVHWQPARHRGHAGLSFPSWEKLCLVAVISQQPPLCLVCVLCSVASVVSDSLWLYQLPSTRLLWPWDSPGKNTGVGCHALLQGIFPTQGSNQRLLGLLHWQALVLLGKSLCLASSPLTPLNYSLYPKWKFWLSTILSFQHPRILYCIFSNVFVWYFPYTSAKSYSFAYIGLVHFLLLNFEYFIFFNSVNGF